MPKHLQKSLQDYLSKIRKPSPGCRKPKTLSFAVERNQKRGKKVEEDDGGNDNAATLSDIDRFLFENFNSLYIKEDESKERKDDQDEVEGPTNGGILFESPRFMDSPPEVCGVSHRFFVGPGLSSSLIEEARSSLTITSDDMGSISISTSTKTHLNSSTVVSSDSTDLPEDCIAVLKYSRNLYEDFRRSMQEMVEARLTHQAKLDWDFMEGLLFTYLDLNDKTSHKFILSAFVDLITVLRQKSNDDGVPRVRLRNFRIARRGRRGRRARHET